MKKPTTLLSLCFLQSDARDQFVPLMLLHLLKCKNGKLHCNFNFEVNELPKRASVNHL